MPRDLERAEAVTTALALTFHAIAGDHPNHSIPFDPAALRYTISKQAFEVILESILPDSTCTVAEFVDKTVGTWSILTFDDGLISDFEVAFPALLARGVRATFFVTAADVGRPGYTTIDHLIELADAGMEIASHGLTHHYLVRMSHADAVRQICESKKTLEQRIGIPITSFAPVGGHFHTWMLKSAHDAGYRAFATMVPGRTCGNKDMVVLRRNHIQAHHNEDYISRLLSGHRGTLTVKYLRYHLLTIPKVILGIRTYDRIKGILMNARTHVRPIEKK